MSTTRWAEILHVEIVDNRTGEVLADVDASSTADAMAYYLESRRINEAEAAKIRRHLEGTWPDPRFDARAWRRSNFVYEERNVITGVADVYLFARVH